MNVYDGIVDCCLDNSGNGTDDDRDKDLYTAIILRENKELVVYNNAFSSERDIADELVSSVQEEEENGTTLTRSIRVVDNGDTEAIHNNEYIFVPVKLQECILHESQALQGGGLNCHFYYIQDDQHIKLRSLNVTVVFKGNFDGSQYIPGNISVKLRRLSNDKDKEQSVVIGNTPEELRFPNTLNRIGRVVIQHEQKNTVIDCGLFAVEVTADNANTSYSISLGGNFACPLLGGLKHEMASSMAKRNEIIELSRQIATLEKEFVLLERKQTNRRKLVEQARRLGAIQKAEMESLDLELDDQDDQDEWSAIVQQMNELKLEYDYSCQLLSLRSNQAETLSSEMERMKEDRNNLHQQAQKSRKEANDSMALLSGLIFNLWGEQTSSHIMKRLESDENDIDDPLSPDAGRESAKL